MDKEKIEQIRKFGFEVSREGRNGECYISMPNTPSNNIVIKMLQTLSFEDEIFFWDYFHPTISDPGGYVTAYMLDENRCAYMEGNHGWSSDYKIIPVEDFADLVIKNWDKDWTREENFVNAIEVGRHLNIERDLFLYKL